MRIFVVSLCCLAFALLSFDAVGEEKEQDKKKKSYASAAADCDRAIAEKKSSLAESYSSEVWNLKQRFQKDGDLEKALAADKEWSRSIRREPLTPEDLVESPRELRTLQDAYVDRQERVEREVAEEVVGQLQREASELAKAGNLAAGRVLQQEIDKIKRLYLGGRDPKPQATSKADGDPVAACEEMIRRKRVALQAQYVGELEALEKAFQAKGALEDLFAAKAERKRFMETPLLADENLVETPAPLLELQHKYLELQQNVTTSVAEEFVARLEQQKQAFTIEGKLDEALATKGAADTLRLRFLDMAAAAKVPVRKGLYAEYLFEGNVKDTSGKKRHGVLRGASADYITGQDGSKGSALKFDGRVSVDLGYRFDLEEFTLSLWLKPDSAQVVFAILIDNSHGTGWGWVTQQLNSDANLYYLGLSSTDGKHVSAHFRLTPSRWQHVALVVSRDRCCTYLDGQVAEALPRTARLNLRGQGNLWLGNFSGDVENSSGRNWRGAIDDVAIYSRPLSAQEVRSLGKHVIRDESNPFSQ